MISNVHFQKTSFFYFLKNIILFTLKIYFFYNERCPKCRKNKFFSNMFTFLSVIRQNVEYNLRILVNFCVKTQKSMYIFKKLVFFGIFNKDYTFYTKNPFFFITKDAQSFVKISFLVTYLDF